MDKMNDYVFDAVVLAGGDYPTASQPLEVLHGAKYVVCCDGAADHYISLGHTPDAIVGDGDSISVANREKYVSILHVINEQESNDQTKAVRFLMAQGKRRIAIVGATGHREDHTIGNVSLLVEYARMGAEVCSFTDYGVFVPCSGTTIHRCRKGQQLSIFCITANALSAEGLLYPIYDFKNWWQGTLNECTGDSVTIHAQGEYLLFFNY
ncbi:MAG: thiamine diphosphokinase [Bacteroidaceae bacterium]|nr:thiamine diphosphokinase [Bacteroidaceae bacterium]MBR5275718.1 thiamine diphosphokinase [Bacteroidaceae bacterium]MBR5891177.1 thiamine diphosphokinase [Bacteroidaceae bacterium]